MSSYKGVVKKHAAVKYYVYEESIVTHKVLKSLNEKP